MKRPMEAVTHIGLALMIAATGPAIVSAQTRDPVSANNSSEALKALDQVIEQNRKLEQQNRELMEQVNALRQRLAAEPAKAEARATSPTVAPAGSGSGGAQADEKQAAGNQPYAATPNSFEPNTSVTPKPLSVASEGSPVMFGEFNPGDGFNVARGEQGRLDLSGILVARYLNQFPASQHSTDHLGRPYPVTPRQDFQFHRVMLFAKGWLFNPKFNYQSFVWTVQDTNQVAIGGALWYMFNKHFTFGGGWQALPGTQSLQGSHPYWTSYDRVMADEFFRPYFTQGVFGAGLLAPRLEYRWTVGNNLSNLDVSSKQLDRNLATSGALTWLPTTGEFGPRGAFGDYEMHEKLATRFNLAYTRSGEDRYSNISDSPANTTLRLADGLNVFDINAFRNGVTVTKLTYQLATAAAGMKYHGFWLQGEGYARLLNNFVSVGTMPVGAVRDYGFYAQASYMAIPRKIELYGATSYVFSNYGHPKEWIAGGNYYPWNTRNLRLNVQLINVDHSPVSSAFGFYTGRLTGQSFATGFTVIY